jgi:hypothetical protein
MTCLPTSRRRGGRSFSHWTLIDLAAADEVMLRRHAILRPGATKNRAFHDRDTIGLLLGNQSNAAARNARALLSVVRLVIVRNVPKLP